MSERAFQSIVAEHCKEACYGSGVFSPVAPLPRRSLRSVLKEPITILRFPEVKARVGKSRSSIYAGIADGTFPQAISLSVRSVGWIEEEIQNWLSDRIEQTRGRVPAVLA